MNISLPNLNLQAIPKISNNFKSQPISFKAKADTVEFSTVAKEKSDILHQLTEAGYSSKYASIMMKKYVGTENYNDLVNGACDVVDGEYYPLHCVGKILDRNLTPAEAIVYLEESMDNYYMQHEPVSMIPADYTNLALEVQNYDIGKADFTPLELAKQIKKGYPIEVAGMILKGKIDEETADKVLKYYEASSEGNELVPNVQVSECRIEKLAQDLDRMDIWTSEEEDENGKLKSGLTRPLTNYEAYIFVACEPFWSYKTNKTYSSYTDSINEYINDMVEYENRLVQQKQEKVIQPNIPLYFDDLQGKLNYIIGERKRLGKTADSPQVKFLEALKGLDNEKFFSRYPEAAIRFDVLYSNSMDEELTRKNIEVLNGISVELLDKMTSRKTGKVGHFACLYRLLKTKDLEERIKTLEDYRTKSPELFAAMPRENILDYLTNTKIYSESKRTGDEFLATLYPGRYGELPKDQSAEIIPFAPVES